MGPTISLGQIHEAFLRKWSPFKWRAELEVYLEVQSALLGVNMHRISSRPVASPQAFSDSAGREGVD